MSINKVAKFGIFLRDIGAIIIGAYCVLNQPIIHYVSIAKTKKEFGAPTISRSRPHQHHH